jgi:SAM-dependent methyltransferase
VTGRANPFAGGVAERYHLGRPRHHERTLRRAPLDGVGVAIDVAGGTGLSTEALRALGYDAMCLDVSLPMLQLASPPKVAAAAESLPFPDGCAAVLSVSSGVHWFDQTAFFAEARRVLASDGLLVLYEHGFHGVPDDDRFQGWAREVYRARYPTPPRGSYPGEIVATGFTKLGQEPFTELIPLSNDALVAYFLTQSNTARPVDAGEETLDEVRTWLRDETAPFFADCDERAFTFWGSIEWWSPTS